MVTIRPFQPTEEEYDAIVALYNAAWPDERHFSGEMWRENDEEWPPGSLHRRFVLERDGRILGMGSCYEKYWQHKPGTVHIDFHVYPEMPGLDALLYKHLIAFLESQETPPHRIATEAREDRPRRIEFLRTLGFQPTMRSPRASLTVADFDPAPFQELEASLAADGVQICTLSDLIERDPQWKQHLYELRWAIIQDVPAVEPPTRPSFAQFEQMVLQDPALNKDAWFVAVDIAAGASAGPGLLVGMSNLWINDASFKRLDTGLTGVLGDYRRRRIATALKVRTIKFAQNVGAQTIETGNEEDNPMVGLNLKLGFRPGAAWVSFRKLVQT